MTIQKLRAKLLVALCHTKPSLAMTMRLSKARQVLEISSDEYLQAVVSELNETGLVCVTMNDIAISVAVNGGNADDVATVFEHWKMRKGAGRATLTPKRKRVIVARLRDRYTVEQLTAACDELFKSEFHTSGGYTDVEHFAGSVERVDKWLEKAAIRVKSDSCDQVDDELMRIRREQKRRNRGTS